jgi:DNA-binding MarR family transcriptional regulator
MSTPTPVHPDELTQDARQLLTAINQLTRIHTREQRRGLSKLRLPTSQAHALESLCTDGALSLSELAAQIHLDISTASRMIDILEQKGLLRRSPDPHDARSLKLEATENGREKFKQIEAEAIERMKGLIGNADPELRQAAVRIVEWLAGNASGAGTTDLESEN